MNALMNSICSRKKNKHSTRILYLRSCSILTACKSHMFVYKGEPIADANRID